MKLYVIENNYYDLYDLLRNFDTIENIQKKFKYFYMNETSREVVFVVTDVFKGEEDVTGLAGLGFYRDSQIGDYYGIHYVTVDPKYRNHGYASFLIEEIFKYAQKKNVQLYRSQFTDMGKSYLKDVINRMKKKYPKVKFIDPEEN